LEDLNGPDQKKRARGKRPPVAMAKGKRALAGTLWWLMLWGCLLLVNPTRDYL